MTAPTKWLYVFCEGYTEEEFVNTVLARHLQALGAITVIPIVLGAGRHRRDRGSAALGKGGGAWKSWYFDIELLTKEQRGQSIRFTTLIDLYGLPRDFPTTLAPAPTGEAKADALQARLGTIFNEWRLIPYIQVFEFEALVLACMPALGQIRGPDDATGIASLVAEIGDQPPATVNDSRDTAPSKRILRHVPGYSKVEDGPWAIEETGLSAVRRACPRFGQWLAQLEAFVQLDGP